jgi:uridylate kinase
MGNPEHCREVCLLDENILLAAIIENANLLGVYSKKPMAPPNEQRFKVLRIQTELMVSMAKNNEDFFGELGYLMFHSRHLDMFLFPMGRSRKLKIMAVAVKQPYNHEDIVDKIMMHMAKMKD